MTTLRTAAQQALEALEYAQSLDIPHFEEHVNALVALRTALAEPEQEPVAWQYEAATAVFESGEYGGWQRQISEKEPCAPENSIRNLQPLYTHPQADTQLLRRVVELLEPIAHNTTDDPRGKAYEAITALRKLLG